MNRYKFLQTRPGKTIWDFASMPLKRIIFLFLLGALLVPLGGCVYLRLLEVKHQLADFEKHCVLENRDALAVIFLKPVLRKEDILHLAKRGLTFVYRLQRSGPDSGPPTEARTRLTFLKGVEDLVEAEAKFAGMGFSLSLRKGKGS